MIAPVAKKRGAIKVEDHTGWSIERLRCCRQRISICTGVGEQIKEKDGRKRVGVQMPRKFPEGERDNRQYLLRKLFSRKESRKREENSSVGGLKGRF